MTKDSDPGFSPSRALLAILALLALCACVPGDSGCNPGYCARKVAAP